MISFPAINIDTAVLGLGIDAGGTQTRWALAGADGAIVADGAVEGLSALQMSSDAGRAAVHATFAKLSQAVLAVGHPRAVVAGLTGFGGDDVTLAELLAELLALDAVDVRLGNDIDIAYRDSFEPGEGYLVYAGTGSIAAWIDADGVFHRAGGRGVLLDDGGGGYWVAREALRHIWRRQSPSSPPPRRAAGQRPAQPETVSQTWRARLRGPHRCSFARPVSYTHLTLPTSDLV